jgi:hypothetical protein
MMVHTWSLTRKAPSLEGLPGKVCQEPSLLIRISIECMYVTYIIFPNECM